MDGTQEIGLAVLATTLSIVAVFMPIGFMGGIIGKFFHEFGITIVAAVLISMFVSFTLDPMLSSSGTTPASTRTANTMRRSRCTTRPSAAYTPVGSSLEATEAKARQVKASCASFPRCATRCPPSTPATPRARCTPAFTCAWSTARTAAAAWMPCRACCASACKQVPGITVTHVGLLDPVGGQKQMEFSLQGPDLGNWSA
jgi:hypothetical protein